MARRIFLCVHHRRKFFTDSHPATFSGGLSSTTALRSSSLGSVLRLGAFDLYIPKPLNVPRLRESIVAVDHFRLNVYLIIIYFSLTTFS